ncbi:MAG: YdcF family protein [Firmicutes bacterium]|nr:YdcF family protein [Bacillota bacterium]
MKKVSIQIGIATLLLLIIGSVFFLTNKGTVIVTEINLEYEPRKGWHEPPESMAFEIGEEGVAQVEAVKIRRGYIMLRIKAIGPGETEVYITNRENPEGSRQMVTFVRVNRNGVILSNGVEFGGASWLFISIGIYLFAVCSFFLIYFIKAGGNKLYSYSSIFAAGMVIYTGVSAISVLHAGVMNLVDPFNNSLLSAFSSVSGTAQSCMALLTVPMLIFSAAMIISNIELLRHEKAQPANILGLVIPFLLIGGLAFPFVLLQKGFQGSFEEYRTEITIENIYASIYVYFECMLAGSVICGLRATKQRIPFNKDYIIILGCGFRNDGTLPPLLKGRCDRAVQFWKDQKEASGQEAVIIPSGGQGDDEPMPEAEAMARYLIGQGIPEHAILREDRSTNTRENMAFSKKLIDTANPDAKVAFSTTNYHVFRSGLLAAEEGLTAEGIGSKTKWWFWPNAFMRECVGLMAKRIREEVILLAIIIATCIVLTYICAR